jgi:ubiquinone/menaquinone biosynthesis C-methylase UbiE
MSVVSGSVRTLLGQVRGKFHSSEKDIFERKHASELGFWEGWVAANGPGPEPDYYRKFMMDMGDIRDESFFANRICLDIGCGPMGSLSWLRNARAAIGLDPLADSYMKFGIGNHNMLYLSASAERIPLPSRYVDVVFSMNSLDHVDDFPSVCTEIRRVLKVGGFFIGSLNLDELPTVAEPWTLTEDLLEKHLFKGWEKQFYKTRPRLGDPAHFGPYKYFYEECPKDILQKPGPRALWCRFRVR